MLTAISIVLLTFFMILYVVYFNKHTKIANNTSGEGSSTNADSSAQTSEAGEAPQRV